MPIETPSNLIDCLSCQIFREPVFTEDGETYERECIQRWFDQGSVTNPRTNLPLPSNRLITNVDKIREVDDFITLHPQALDEMYLPENLKIAFRDAIVRGDFSLVRSLLQKDFRLLVTALQLEQRFDGFNNTPFPQAKSVLDTGLGFLCQHGTEAMLNWMFDQPFIKRIHHLEQVIVGAPREHFKGTPWMLVDDLIYTMIQVNS